jgi:hypothetical protein
MIEWMRISESLDCWYSNNTFRVSSSFLSSRLESIPKFSCLSTFSTSSSSRISLIYSFEILIGFFLGKARGGLPDLAIFLDLFLGL